MNRRGVTLIEIMLVIAMIGLISLFGYPRIRQGLLKQNVRSARDAIATLHAKAKAGAVHRGRGSSLVFSGGTVLVLVRDGVTGALDTLDNPTDVSARWGVRITRTRDTLRFDARGIGLSTTPDTVNVTDNTGSFADTLVISRLGRVLK